MKAFRSALEFWNESGLILSLCLCIGYFGSRALLGWFPLLLAIAGIIACIVLSWMLASATTQTSEDEWQTEPRNKTIDKFMLYLLCFVSGMAIFVTLGAII